MKFREFLLQEFMRRKERNPRYSLRAFAKLLKIENSFLSKMLRGKKPISADFLKKAADILDLTDEQVRKFEASVIPSKKNNKNTSVFHEMDTTDFSLISNWYNLALLELVGTRRFRKDPQWIAAELGISIDEVNLAIERLKKLNYLKVSSGKLVRSSGPVTTVKHTFTNEELKKFQKQMLTLASRAMDTTPFDLRDQSGMTLPVRLKDIPKVKQKIKQFRRSILAFVDNETKKSELDQVYQLSISFFPLTHRSKE